MKKTTQHSEQPYRAWLQRVQRVQLAYNAGQISAQALCHYQQFILDFGQFNANFTFDELVNLGYPCSPMAQMHRHTYLRGSETWATEMLRQLFKNAYPSNTYLYPLFIDSPFFLDEIRRYYTVLDSDRILGADSAQYLTEQLTPESSADTLICLSYPDEKEDTEQILYRHCLAELVESKIPENLRPLFLSKNHKSTDAEKQWLDVFLKDELALYQQRENEKAQTGERYPYGKVYGVLKGQNPTFLSTHQLDSKEALASFAEKEPALFDAMYQQLSFTTSVKKTYQFHSKHYAAAIQNWLADMLKPRLSKLYYYWSPEKPFMGIDTWVLVGNRAAEKTDGWGPKALVNRLGYRVELARAASAVLTEYPLLFIDTEQTAAFWQKLEALPMVKALDTKIPSVDALFLPVSTNAKACTTRRFQRKVDKLSHIVCDGIYIFYRELIRKFSVSFIASHSLDSGSYSVMMPELFDAIRQFVHEYRHNNQAKLSQCIRAAQSVTELIALHLAIYPIPNNQLLRNVVPRVYHANNSLQSVSLLPFGMRAYLMVLQASNFNQAAKIKPNIYVTNQNYFEWLHSLDELPQQLVKITHVRQLEDIDRAADYIFMEIHPNNVTEKKQFSQNLDLFLKRLVFEEWFDKKRTLVFDATLHALDDPEVLGALKIAEPLVKKGALNIVLIQSLTKFAQGGLDKRSGGLVMVINNGKTWQSFNQAFKAVREREPASMALLQYFSYFLKSDSIITYGRSMNIEYITMINGRVNRLYHLIQDELKQQGDENLHYLQLTNSGDHRGCYIALHTREILSLIDPTFTHSARDIERLNKGLVEEVLIKLSQQLDLPISARMSIAFPLSSVNVALDAIRFTPGLEDHHTLKSYAKIIAHIARELNQPANIAQLFLRDVTGSYSQRMAFFDDCRGRFNESLLPRPNKAQPEESTIYGPFPSRAGNAYFFLAKGELHCKIEGTVYEADSIALLQGNIALSCLKLSRADFLYFLKAGGYTQDEKASQFLQLYPNYSKRINNQYIPLKSDRTEITFGKLGIGVDRDYVCIQRHGLTIYKRAFSADATIIEMDYWQEKDPTVSRFLTFILAAYLKQQHNISYKVRSSNNTSSLYTHFLFQIPFEKTEHYFSEAWSCIYAKRAELLNYLDRRQSSKTSHPTTEAVFLFSSFKEPGSPYDSRVFNGPTRLPDVNLMDDIFSILGCKKRLSSSHAHLFHQSNQPNSTKNTTAAEGKEDDETKIATSFII